MTLLSWLLEHATPRGRTAWAAHSFTDAWINFVHSATARQPYWTPETLAGTALRYPALDLAPWNSAPSR